MSLSFGDARPHSIGAHPVGFRGRVPRRWAAGRVLLWRYNIWDSSTRSYVVKGRYVIGSKDRVMQVALRRSLRIQGKM